MDWASQALGYLSAHCLPLTHGFYQNASHVSMLAAIQATSANGPTDHPADVGKLSVLG